MQQATHQISISTRGKGLYNITREIRPWVIKQKLSSGLLTIFIPHTSASLVIQENADPDVLHDLTDFFQRLVPDGDSSYLHRSEGPDDMPAHLKSSILGSSVNIPITDGKLNLGTWQGIYLCEHRNRGGSRKLVVTIQGK